MAKRFIGFMALLLMVVLVGGAACAVDEPIVSYSLDSIDVVDPSLYTDLSDLRMLSVQEDFWFVFLSGWQLANHTEYMYAAQNVVMRKDYDDVVLYDIWSELYQGAENRVSILLLLKKSTYPDMESILEIMNRLDLDITVEQSDCFAETEAIDFHVEVQPQVHTVRDSAGLAGRFRLLDQIAYQDAVAKNVNVEYDAELIKRNDSVSQIACWEITYQIDSPFPIQCAFGFHSSAYQSRMMAFNTSDPLVHLPSDTTFLLVGYDEQEPSRSDVMRILHDMDIEVLISPEPYLFGQHLGGPYYAVPLQIEGME